VTGRALYTAAVAGCTVFIDTNGNQRLDANEPSTTTWKNGKFILEIVESDPPAPVVVELAEANAEGCRDPANLTPPVMLLSAPSNCSIITPLSTLVAALTEGEFRRPK
jgi:hypothetical protein